MAALIGLDSTSSGFDPGLQDPPITFGVWGDSGDADGVIGSSNAGVGVFGRSIAAAAAAVRGSSQNGTGVQATSAGGTALHARRDPGGGAAVTEAFLATPSLAADFRGDVATSGALRVGGRPGAAGELRARPDGGVDVNLLAATNPPRTALGIDPAGNIGIGIGDAPAQRPLHVEGSEVHSGGPGGGFSFADRATGAFVENPANGERWRWYAQGGSARLWSGADRLTIDKSGNIGVGTDQPRRPLHVEGSEIHSGGPGGGLSFADRGAGSFVESPNAGQRWAWYAKDGTARLWSGEDRLTIDKSGNIGIGIGAGQAKRPLHVMGHEVHSGGHSAGFSFADRTTRSDPFVESPNVGQRWVWYAWDGIARLWCGWDQLSVAPTGYIGIGIGAGQAKRPLHVEGLEVHSGGPIGGFSFADRSIGSFVEAPTAGQRWVWYAYQGAARLWSGGDKLHISHSGDATFYRNVTVTGTLTKGHVQFRIDHPLDPANKFLQHSGIECDEMKNLYDGVVDLDAHGRAEVVLPDWFEALNQNFRYQLTPLGAAAPDLHIADELRDGRFAIAGGPPNTTVCWLVSGVRHDAYAQAHPLQVETLKSSEEAGLFLHPEEHHQPAERSLATLFTAPANDSVQG